MFNIQLSFVFEQLLNKVSSKRLRQEQRLAWLSDGDLQTIWTQLISQYFPSEQTLNCYQIKWSDRKQKRCLASCNPRRRKVLVARALANPSYAHILPPLLYHEMCHAVIGAPKKINGRNSFHGREFKTIEKRHPDIQRLNLWIKNGGWANAKRAYTRSLRRF